MGLSLSSPVTGVSIPGYTTSGTYTLTASIAPENNALQYNVTALGGVQAGVLVHSVSNPYTVMLAVPRVLKQLPEPNNITGKIANIPRNVYRGNVRKALLVTDVTNSSKSNGIFRWELDLPAGSDTADPNSIASMIDLAIAALHQIRTGLHATALSGSL